MKVDESSDGKKCFGECINPGRELVYVIKFIDVFVSLTG